MRRRFMILIFKHMCCHLWWLLTAQKIQPKISALTVWPRFFSFWVCTSIPFSLCIKLVTVIVIQLVFLALPWTIYIPTAFLTKAWFEQKRASPFFAAWDFWMRWETDLVQGSLIGLRISSFHWNLLIKGQLISERNFGVFKSPKKRTKFLKDFCSSL